MIKINYARFVNFAIFSVLLPFVYGCQGGGGAGGLSFLGGGGGGGDIIGGGSSFVTSSDGGASIATLHHPEPGTMLLLGSGFMAMAFYRNKKSPKK